MIPGSLDQIDQAALERLVTDQVHEGRTIEYKRDIALSNDERRRELARDVSSFANAAGGDLIFGVEEAKDENGKNLGYPEKIVGVECANFDDTKLRIEGIIRENIDPRIHGVAIHKVDGFERGPVIIVRVPRSWNAPHMVSYKSQTHFFSRNSAGKHPLDVREIKAAFLDGTEQAARVRRFRDERLGRIIAGETPAPLDVGSGVMLALHIVPVPGSAIDVVAVGKDAGRLQPPSGGGWNSRFNLDGVVTFSGPNNGPQDSYLQVFRNGSFEAASSVRTFGNGSRKEFSALPIETVVVRVTTQALSLLRDAGVDGPKSVLVAVLGAKGARLWVSESQRLFDRGGPIDRSPLVLPDVLIDAENPDVPALLKPIFDALWQSSGWEGSLGYDAAGQWRHGAHR